MHDGLVFVKCFIAYHTKFSTTCIKKLINKFLIAKVTNFKSTN